MKDYQAYNDQLFGRWAPIYDIFELLLAGIRKEVVQEINAPGKSILDVATGIGSLALELSHSAKKVVGIDLSAKMLEVAKGKKGGDNLSFLQMDASQMIFDDEEFDIVTISLGLHDMPIEIRTAVLKEVKRVLKTGGKLYVFEHDMPKNELLGQLSSNIINLLESRYFLDFVHSDFEAYLKSLGFKVEKKTNYLLDHFRLLTLSK
jgi:ubiquinone/menaquinone biosynthesis C-methylase UbiE